MTDLFDRAAPLLDPKSCEKDSRVHTHVEFLRSLHPKRNLLPIHNSFEIDDIYTDATNGDANVKLDKDFSINESYPLDGGESADAYTHQLDLPKPNPNTKRNWLAQKLKGLSENIFGFMVSLPGSSHTKRGGKWSNLPLFPYDGSHESDPNINNSGGSEP